MAKKAIFVLYFLCPFIVGSVWDIQEVTTEASNEDVLKKIEIIDNSMRRIIDNVIHQLSPSFIEIGSQVAISEKCRNSILKFVIDLRRMKEWPLKMLDASGKIPTGLLSGHKDDLGHYDQCLDVVEYNHSTKEPILQGQYCFVQIRPPLPPKPKRIRFFENLEPFKNYTTDNYLLKRLSHFARLTYDTSISVALCVPSWCSKNDIKNLSSTISGKVGFQADVMSCEIKEPVTIDQLQYALIGIFFTFCVLCIIGTAVDFLMQTPDEKKQISIFYRILTSFSLDKNIRLLVKINPSNNTEVQCIHGIRFFATLGVILGHTYIFAILTKSKNILQFEKATKRYSSQIPFNAGTAVESFFCLSGMLTSYATIISIAGKHFTRFIPMIILRRIWRLLPGMLMIVGFSIVMPLLGSGPSWNAFIVDRAHTCRKNWFYEALFLSSFIRSQESCWGHFWYVSVDTQFLILAIIVLAIFFKKPRWSMYACSTLIAVSIGASVLMTYFYEFDPMFGIFTVNKEYVNRYNSMVLRLMYSHMSAYFIGFIAGTLLANKDKRKISRVWRIIGWCLCFIIGWLIMFGPYEWTIGRRATLVETLLYAGFYKALWGLVVAWIIYACSCGYGGVVNRILSFKGWIPFSRLTYMAYAWHMPVLFYYISSLRESIFVQDTILVCMFLGITVVSFLVAFVAHVLLDGPISLLGKILFENSSKKPKNLEKNNFSKEVVVTISKSKIEM